MRSWLKSSVASIIVSAALAIGAAGSAQAAIHPGGGHGGFHGGGFHGRAFAGNYGYRHGGYRYYGGGYPYGYYGYGYNCNPLLLPVPPFICY